MLLPKGNRTFLKINYSTKYPYFAHLPPLRLKVSVASSKFELFGTLGIALFKSGAIFKSSWRKIFLQNICLL